MSLLRSAATHDVCSFPCPRFARRSSRKVTEAIRKQKDPRQVSKELVAAAREAGSGDDITVVIAKLG